VQRRNAPWPRGLPLLATLAAIAGCKGTKGPSLERVGEAELAIPDVRVPDEDGPRLGIIGERAPVQDRPSESGRVLGYLRAGATVARTESPLPGDGCPEGWFPIRPRGFVCAGSSATRDLAHPTLTAMAIQADRTAALPFTYARVSRDTRWFEVDPGNGAAIRPLAALRAKSGLAVVGSWSAAETGGEAVPLAMGTGGHFVPTADVEALSGSRFEGVPLADATELPVAFVVKRGVRAWTLKGDLPVKGALLAYHERVDLTGKSRDLSGVEFWATRDGRWVRLDDVTLIRKRHDFPALARTGQKWLDVSVITGSLVAYEGTKPVFATLVSVGRDRLGGPGQTGALSQRGEFEVTAKHLTAVGHPAGSFVEGISTHDVPWVLELSSGQLLLGAYWHDRFGIERSLGNVELSPRDAARLFEFAEPALPQGWHSVYSGGASEKTLVVIRK
jgi:hypothetical protein